MFRCPLALRTRSERRLSRRSISHIRVSGAIACRDRVWQGLGDLVRGAAMSVSEAENRRQYGDVRKIAARARLLTCYTIADTGWFPWVAAQMPLDEGARLLDVGCGPGWFWASCGPLPTDLDLTLVDRCRRGRTVGLPKRHPCGLRTGRRGDRDQAGARSLHQPQGAMIRNAVRQAAFSAITASTSSGVSSRKWSMMRVG